MSNNKNDFIIICHRTQQIHCKRDYWAPRFVQRLEGIWGLPCVSDHFKLEVTKIASAICMELSANTFDTGFHCTRQRSVARNTVISGPKIPDLRCFCCLCGTFFAWRRRSNLDAAYKEERTEHRDKCVSHDRHKLQLSGRQSNRPEAWINPIRGLSMGPDGFPRTASARRCPIRSHQ